LFFVTYSFCAAYLGAGRGANPHDLAVGGFQIRRVQRGLKPVDSKPMPSIGRGVEEIRIWDEAGTFRVIYTARLADVVYVLHAFQQKTEGTSQRDIDKAKSRFAELIRERR